LLTNRIRENGSMSSAVSILSGEDHANYAALRLRRTALTLDSKKMTKTLKNLGIVAIISVVIFIFYTIFYVYKLPGLSRGPKELNVFNCDEPRNKNAASVCPKLFCEKFLRENGKIDEDSFAQITNESGSASSSVSIIQGIIKTKKMNNHYNMHFYCRMNGDRVLEAEVITGKEWAIKLRNGEFDI